MIDIFELSTGEEIEPTDNFVNTGFQPLIPAGTKLLCAIASATWEDETKYNSKSIKIGLHIVERGPYKDFLVNDNVKLFDEKASVADKARTKLATYDKLCTGSLMKARNAGKDIVDDNTILARALCAGEVVVEFDVWEMEGSDGVTRTGNWVKSIGPKSKELQEEDKAIMQKAKSQPKAKVAPFVDDFDDAPF